MVDVVFVIVLSGSDEEELTVWIVGGKKADFAGGVACGGKDEKGRAPSLVDLEAKALIGFIVEKEIRGSGAENVTVKAMGALGEFVFEGVEECAIVGGPGDAGDALEGFRKDRVGLEVFHEERELAVAGGVCGISEITIVFADFEGFDREKGIAFGELVKVQEQFFG